MARVTLMISARVRKEFSSSSKQAKAGWFAPSLSLWKAEQRCPVTQAMGTTPVMAASDSCRVRSPQACPSDCVESPCAHWVSEPALKRVRKALESSGTSTSMPSLSRSERYLRPAFLMHEREPARSFPLVWIMFDALLLTRQLEWCPHLGKLIPTAVGPLIRSKRGFRMHEGPG